MAVNIQGDNSAASPGLTGDDTDTGVRLGTNELSLVTGGTNRVTVDSSGKLNVAVTGAANGSTTEGLIIDNDNSNTGDNLATRIRFNRSSNSGTNVYTALDSIRTGTHDTDFAISLNFGGTTTERFRLTSTGNLQYNSGFGSVQTAFACRCWVCFNGTGTIAIKESGNVSSLTDLGTGAYRVNFSNAMPDANFCTVGSNIGSLSSVNANTNSYLRTNQNSTSVSTAHAEVVVVHTGGSAEDHTNINVAVFR